MSAFSFALVAHIFPLRTPDSKVRGYFAYVGPGKPPSDRTGYGLRAFPQDKQFASTSDVRQARPWQDAETCYELIYSTSEGRKCNMAFTQWPDFNQLPLDPNGPPGNAWGLWGKDDQLGMLNLLTPGVVAASAREIQHGTRISLDWPFDKPAFPTDGRKRFEHRIIHHPDVPMNDDEVYLNTQSSTQWDGFRHFEWVNKGGIIGRGVLVDWAEWATRNGREVKALQTSAVLLPDIQTIIEEKNLEFRQGDILFLRVGFTAAYNALTAEERREYPNRQPGGLLGLEATQESLRWLWESRFAAIAFDSPSFERGPVNGPYNHPDVSIHQWVLAGWGLPLGEMFDLEELASTAHRLGRYSFFLSSVPIKVPGGVASPPNAVAIF